MGRGAGERRRPLRAPKDIGAPGRDLFSGDAELTGRYLLHEAYDWKSWSTEAATAEGRRLAELEPHILRELLPALEARRADAVREGASFESAYALTRPGGLIYHEVVDLRRQIRSLLEQRERSRLRAETARLWKRVKGDPDPLTLERVFTDPGLPAAIPLARLVCFDRKGTRLMIDDSNIWTGSEHRPVRSLGDIRAHPNVSLLIRTVGGSYSWDRWPDIIVAKPELGEVVLEAFGLRPAAPATPAALAPTRTPSRR